MAKLSKRGSSKKQPKEGRGAKRKRPAGEEAGEARDEFFADSNAEAGGSDAEVAEADVQETAAEKRLRLGEAWCQVISWKLISALLCAGSRYACCALVASWTLSCNLARCISRLTVQSNELFWCRHAM